MCQVRPYCHNPKDKDRVKVRVSKVTVVIWAIRCTVSRVHNTAEAREVWVVATTNLEGRIIKPVVTELTDPVMARGSMETATVADGVRAMGTELQKSQY